MSEDIAEIHEKLERILACVELEETAQPEHKRKPQIESDFPGGTRIDDHQLLQMAQSECLRRELRNRVATQSLGGAAEQAQGPSWNILLELYVNYVSRRQICVKAACLASRVPSTTATRYISALESAGLIARDRDEVDTRRYLLRLTAKGAAFMKRYFLRISEISGPSNPLDRLRRLE
jgi:DNA-binding MarR family transcriptional regulator